MPKIMQRMNTVSRCQSLYRAARMSDEQIAPCQHSFVFAICRAPGQSQDQLARRLCFNKSTVARTIASMEEKGLVTRTPQAKDKRVLLVYPTEKLLALLPEVRRITEEWNDIISRDVSEEEMAIFCRVLDKLSVSAREAVGLCEGEATK